MDGVAARLDSGNLPVPRHAPQDNTARRDLPHHAPQLSRNAGVSHLGRPTPGNLSAVTCGETARRAIIAKLDGI